mmetsp:Transcript_33115/g.40702  ORF Transcript_33115/g.40702 Transcript_33115/m.40702 type:complete len:343 (+) Transcript_33115:51-1079(+)
MAEGPPKRRWQRSLETTPQRETEAVVAMGYASGALPVSAVEESEMKVVFDMETGDPDDVLTLLLLASHPRVQLVAVTITPGSLDQISLVLWMLQELQLPEVRVGAQEWPKNAEKKCMRGKFYDSFGRIPEESVKGIESAAQVLLECCDADTTLLTGGPLHNLGHALDLADFKLGRWVAQGGFAGEGVVPRELQMEKFAGKQMCQTWNFGGNKLAAEAALASEAIARKVLVSKNVCHRAVYDGRFHQTFLEALAGSEAKTTRATALNLLCSAMEKYQRGDGKKLHDPLAMAAVIDESVCTFREVRVFNDRQGWGSVLQTGTNTWISIDYDDERFRQILTGGPT